MEVWIAVCIGLVNALLLVVLLRRSGSGNQDDAQSQALAQSLALQQSMLNVQDKLERVERELRFEITESSRGGRQELTQTLASFQQSQVQQLSLMQTTISDTLNQQLQQLQKSNADKLDEMRRTVDEKLQTTLEKRLSESFKQVAERLEQVHNGLGQMQKLADGVGSLQRVLTNVKTRGMFGEVQLEALLEQVLTVEQYAKQVETKPRSNQRVDFAIRFPGRGGADGEPVWLPIDAKFPREDYERLLDAHDRADAVAAEVSAKALETRIRTEAKSIAESYLAPPHTTDFAILFLPIEGLYAEVLRRPGLMDSLQRDYRVTLAGPTTLLAMLNSLHMGFRTLALEQQASEVWKVLGAVKTEFERYGDWVEKVREQVQKAADTLDRADTRSRQMRRALKNVEALPDAEAQALLPKFDEALDDSDAQV
ncbi:DNA recombination protein RmuC [Limnohabitans sp. B9-3]|uniref:DNA recombination protein RmuC n=1 Tax=Limnohabitans sp. B9-3 TaxID=1100707 RepID=UPI000C1E62EC|nr:DNA recombination protein RmuC [Limnohabitans sp. B9-3]PIT77571.1 DNA recombination protein RmuC [Limnohabitans sp. B9-3]